MKIKRKGLSKNELKEGGKFESIYDLKCKKKKYKKYTKERGIREVKTEQRKFNLTNLKRRKVETLL